MNTYKPSRIFCKAKVAHRCFVLVLGFHLALGDVLRQCRYSVTPDHLQIVNKLIDNQLQNGCSLNYMFTDRQNMTKICYVKAAFPQTQELLKKHFHYGRNSENYVHVKKLEQLILQIYSQRCVQEIEEKHEDDPVKFAKKYSTSPTIALRKVHEVIKIYMELITERSTSINWNCEKEYAKEYSESSTVTSQTTGPTTQYQCCCPTLGHESSGQVSMQASSPWNQVSNPTFLQPQFLTPSSGLAQIPTGTENPRGYQFSDSFIDSSMKTDSSENVFTGISSSAMSTSFKVTSADHMQELHLLSSDEENYFLSTASTPYVNFQTDPVYVNPNTPKNVDQSTAWFMPTASIELSDVFEDVTNSDSGSAIVAASGFINRPTQNGISTLNSHEPWKEDVLKSSRSITSKDSVDESATAILLQKLTSVSSESLEETSAVTVVKRSISLSQLYSNLKADSKIVNVPNSVPVSGVSGKIGKAVMEDMISSHSRNLVQSEQSSKEIPDTPPKVIPSLKSTKYTLSKLSGLLLREAHYPQPQTETAVMSPVLKSESLSVTITDEAVISPGREQGDPAQNMDKESSTDLSAADSGKDLQKNPADHDVSYKTAFIITLACGVLLLLTTLYCYNEQRKLKAHVRKMEENQRLNVCSSKLDMQLNNMGCQHCAVEDGEMSL